MTVDSGRSQDIYKPLATSSSCFTNALSFDVQRHFGNTSFLEMDTLLVNSAELRTVGVIFAFLGVEFSAKTVWTVECLAQHVREFANKDQLPIFFLDEVLPHFDHREGGTRPVSSELRLARNLLRAVGLVTVLMGTNSSAANFITAASNSRYGEAHFWCRLVTRLPPPNAESLKAIGAEGVIKTLRGLSNLSSIGPFLVQQFKSCTPWFIELFVKVVNQFPAFLVLSATEFLDRVLCEMASKVFQAKGNYDTQSFRRAQFCYHLYPFRKPPNSLPNISSSNLPHGKMDCHDPAVVDRSEVKIASREDRIVFVSSHFASLDDEDCDLFIQAHYLSKDKMTAWVPTASFQRARDDSFLYLMLGGGNQLLDFPGPFVSSSSQGTKRMTTLETFWSLINHHNRKSSATVVPTENNAALKLEGADLEVIAAVAVEVASHRGGLGGIEIADFLLQLATELLPTQQHLEWSHPPTFSMAAPTQGSGKKKRMKRMKNISKKRVPYLSAEGDSWPEHFRRIKGVHWGHLSRPKDLDQIDLKILTAQHSTEPEMSAECKNYKNNLNGVVLREILERIPKSSWLHLVICPRMQTNYWTEETKTEWEPFQTLHGLQGSAILRVAKQGSRLTLEPLFVGSVPPTPPSKLVVFFPFEDWIAKTIQDAPRKR